MPSEPLRIAIVGAGPSGTTLARLLQVQSETKGKLQVTVFERETQLHDRDQGGTLDLHDETGLAALKLAGLADTPAFESIARWDGDAMVLGDKHMRRWLSLGSTKDGSWLAQGKPEVDRLQLRQLLLSSLAEGTVVWGKHISRVEQDPWDRTSVLHFEDGTTQGPYDLVVGADGAYSVVRTLLTDQQPFYSGVGGWNMLCPNAGLNRPLMTRLVNHGSLFAFSDGKVVMGQQLGSGAIYISVWAVKPDSWMTTSGYDVRDPKAVKAALLEEFKDWAPELRELVASFDETKIWPRSLVMLPTGLSWETNPGVTLLGDAAHVICPFVGEGVNAAMGDAIGLAKAISSTVQRGWNRPLLAESIRTYEKGMRARAYKSATMTEEAMRLMLFTPNAPEATIEKYVVAVTRNDMPFFAVPVVKLLVKAFYTVYKVVLWWK
jgi:2-polyprenyl-6-methoxyphenol hydroxylase-like FAD-dependent oxidoreductase